MSRLRHHRKAASVLPVPVGARMSADSPRAMAGHPRRCGLVGCANVAANQVATGRWKRSSGESRLATYKS